MANQSFYFYDLETSGINPREARAMQFAGQRTDIELNFIDQSDNFLIKLTPDVLPEPDAVLITGITPQQTITDGISEADFLKYFNEKIATENTIMVGFNNISFDDEFIRFMHYRNFYDAYEWQWKDGRSKWDILDVSRMTRALRPVGINWPFSSDGSPTNRLEYLTSVNKLDHESAHEALSDVRATIALTNLLKQKQPKLFDYLFKLRDKKQLAPMLTSGQPFLYTCGSYPNEFEKTTIAVYIGNHPINGGLIVYDLRHDPNKFTKLKPSEIADNLKWKPGKDQSNIRFPVKILQLNKCPAVAPISVLDVDSQVRLKLDLTEINENLETLKKSEDFSDKVIAAYELLDKKQQIKLVPDQLTVDTELYSGFINESDKLKMSLIRAANLNEIADFNPGFSDDRLELLLPLFKARNYPTLLNSEDKLLWEKYCELKLMSGGENSNMAKYFKRIADLLLKNDLTKKQKYLLEELQLYAQSIVSLE